MENKLIKQQSSTIIKLLVMEDYWNYMFYIFVKQLSPQRKTLNFVSKIKFGLLPLTVAR